MGIENSAATAENRVRTQENKATIVDARQPLRERDRNPPTTSPRATTKQKRSSGACSSKGGALIAIATATLPIMVDTEDKERKTQQQS
eukprot:jgi/Psemu1/33717/gm1.33717_g